LGVSYLPYGDKVVTVGQEGTMKLWDGKEGLFEKQVTAFCSPQLEIPKP
jgi:hypothetical protein